MIPNRNDEPDPMAATRGSREGLETELNRTKIHEIVNASRPRRGQTGVHDRREEAQLKLGVQNPMGPGSQKRPVRVGSKSKQFLIESFIEIEHFLSLASPASIWTFPACLVSMDCVPLTLQKVRNSASQRAGK